MPKDHNNGANSKLNPAPTDVQFATFRRHQERGTTPGNPKWYQREALTVKPFEFKAGCPPVYPRLPTGAAWNAKHNENSVKLPEDLPTRYK